MTKFKSLIALCIVVAIVSTCVLSASAALSSSTSVYWGPLEKTAWAETVGNGPSTERFYVKAWIESMSTGNFSETKSYNNGSSTAIATTGTVSVTYPSPIPLVQYGGSHGY